MALETITSSLAEGYKQLKPGTFRTSAELTTARRTNEDLRDRWFYSANFSMYEIEDGEAVFYFGGREKNPILDNIDEACEQLIKKGNYQVRARDRKAVLDSVDSGQTLRFVLSELALKEDTFNSEFDFFEIDTEDCDRLNPSQRALAEGIYDRGDAFVENMKMFKDAGISKTRVYVLNPDYVNRHMGNDEVARASGITGINYNSIFFTLGRDVEVLFALRGELKST